MAEARAISRRGRSFAHSPEQAVALFKLADTGFVNTNTARL